MNSQNKAHPLCSLESPNGSYTQTNKDIIKFLIDTHFPGNMEIEGENEEPPLTLKPLRQA